MKITKIIFLIFLFSAHITFSAELTSLDFDSQDGKLKIVFNLRGNTSYKYFFLSKPDRLVFDFSQTSTRLNLNSLNKNNIFINKIRSSRNPEYLRVVFDLKQTVKIKTNMEKSAIKQKVQAELIPQIRQIPKVGSAQIKKPPAKPLRDVVIVLDPGHGGKDPGAKGYHRNAEKNIVLGIALKLKKLIDKEPGMRAVLTRSGDYYIGLRKRLAIARKDNADVFVSIHADAFVNKHSSGVSIYALSQKGATSEAARWLAEKENYSELGGVNLSSLDDDNGLIRTVLLDLAQTATISSSLQMGTRVLKSLDQITSLHYHVVEQARFVVLKSPDIPSILIETGFITNPKEELNLSNRTYQERLAQAIFNGLKQYFWDYPPHGTRIEAMANTKLHIVRAGESLKAIAANYKIPTETIISANNLENENLIIGQRLSIPAWS